VIEGIVPNKLLEISNRMYDTTIQKAASLVTLSPVNVALRLVSYHDPDFAWRLK